MKIEQALVLYLIKNKQISLQGIGTFRIDGTFPEVTDNDKPVVIPPEAVSFIYDPKVVEDADLIDFIVLATKKIKPLASADLDSFLTLGRQFLNIGKPFTIQNLGTLEKLKSGDLDFRPGPLIQRVESPQIKIQDEGAETHEEGMFHDYTKSNGSNRKIFITLIIILLLSAGAWAAWHYGFQSKDGDDVESKEIIVPIKDSPLVADSAHTKDSLASAKKIADSISRIDSTKSMIINNNDSVSFNVVVFQTDDKDAAVARLRKIKSFGRKVIMYTDDDSITYKIAHQYHLPLRDSTKLLDSLNKNYYSGKAHVELH